MKVRQLVICAIFLVAAPAIANDAPPTEESVQEFLQLTNVRQLLDQMKGQMDALMTNAMRSAQQGQPQTPERQAVIDRMRDKMAATVSEALN